MRSSSSLGVLNRPSAAAASMRAQVIGHGRRAVGRRALGAPSENLVHGLLPARPQRLTDKRCKLLNCVALWRGFQRESGAASKSLAVNWARAVGHKASPTRSACYVGVQVAALLMRSATVLAVQQLVSGCRAPDGCIVCHRPSGSAQHGWRTIPARKRCVQRARCTETLEAITVDRWPARGDAAPGGRSCELVGWVGGRQVPPVLTPGPKRGGARRACPSLPRPPAGPS